MKLHGGEAAPTAVHAHETIQGGTASWQEGNGRHSQNLKADDTEPDLDPESEDDEEFARARVSSNGLTTFHEESARIWIIGSVAIAVLVGIVSHFRLNLALAITIIGIGVFTTRRSVEQLKKDFIWDTERHAHETATRGKHGRKRFESVEWLNQVITHAWTMVSPELFVAGVDLLEDALKSLSPAVVHSVKVSSLEQGNNPLRLLGIRYLSPDTDITMPPSSSNKPSVPNSQPHPTFTGLPTLSHHREGEDPGSSYVNLEAEFAFRRLPPGAASAGTSSPHFLLHLGIGLVKKLVKFEVPVWVELIGLTGKCRLRLQVIGEPPFVGYVKFCLTKLPAIEIVAKPLSSIDIMQFPGVSPFILSSINSVIRNFVAPKSYTIEMGRFLIGSDVLMKTKSVGIICLVIHSATSLSPSTSQPVPAEGHETGANTTTKQCCPFINVSFSHIAKILYTTRVLSKPFSRQRMLGGDSSDYMSEAEEEEDRRQGMEKVVQWEWEEMVFVRVALDDIEDDESLRISVLDLDKSASDDGLTVLDHERTSTDDILGHVDISLQQLCATPGKFEHGNEELRSIHRGVKSEGRVKFSAAFFPLARSTPLISEPIKSDDPIIHNLHPFGDPLHPPPQSSPLHTGHTPGRHSSDDPNQERAKKDNAREDKKDKAGSKKEGYRPMFADRTQSEGGSRSAAYAQRMREMLDGRLPANSSQKSGILSYQVHQLVDLESSSRSAAGKGKDRESTLPSSYVRVFINEEPSLKTAVKQFSSAPYVNAESECFLRDWTRARVDFVVMDSIEDDHDVILGIVHLELGALLSKNSQSTRWFPLVNGSGKGRLRLSVLFKPIDVIIDPCLREWNVGTVAISNLSIVGLSSQAFGRLHLAVSNGGSRAETGETGTVPWENFDLGSSAQYQIGFPASNLQLGVLDRSISAIKFSFRPEGQAPLETSYFLASLSSSSAAVRVVVPLYSSETSPPPCSRPTLSLPTMPVRRSKRTKSHLSPFPFAHHHHSAPALHDTSTSLSRSSSFSHLSEADSSNRTRRVGTLSFNIKWIAGVSTAHARILPDSLLDVAPIFISHSNALAADPAANPNPLATRIRLPELDKSHDHTSGNNSARRSGEFSHSGSSRRSSFAGSSAGEDSEDWAKHGGKKKRGWIKTLSKKMGSSKTKTA